MNRSFLNRLWELERRTQVTRTIRLHIDPRYGGGTREMSGSAKKFFRLVEAMDEEKKRLPNGSYPASWSPSQAMSDALTDLKYLRRAVEIEGDNRQLFYLLRSLAVGPADGLNAETETKSS